LGRFYKVIAFLNSADNPVPVAEGFLMVGRWQGPPSHGVRSYMTLILRSHVTLCSEKTRINIAVRGRVKRTINHPLLSLAGTSGVLSYLTSTV
jgi:hypothetical protein